MNAISWFIYVAGVVGSVSTLFFIFGLLFTAIGLVGWVGYTISSSARISSDDKDWEAWIALWNGMRLFFIRGFFLMLVSCIIPSKQTMYAIAASQVGEQIISNGTVQGLATDATKALQQWIKDQIDPPPAPRSK